jgi:hypothetical protein
MINISHKAKAQTRLKLQFPLPTNSLVSYIKYQTEMLGGM